MVRVKRRPVIRHQLGQDAEQAAFKHLIARGLKPVARNFRTRRGEIDLIMLDKDCLVFVEVRYRTKRSFVRAMQTVDRHKQRKLASTAALFISRNRMFHQHVCRFDVIGVDECDGDVSVHWLRDAFRPAG